jgi:hypothetical protein
METETEQNSGAVAEAPTQLKGWRKIRKGENLRPGQSIGNSYGALIAHFVRWDSDIRDVAVIELWGPSISHAIIVVPGESPPRRAEGAYRTITVGFRVDSLRVVA